MMVILTRLPKSEHVSGWDQETAETSRPLPRASTKYVIGVEPWRGKKETATQAPERVVPT